jgi:non-specific serine/threonine protein kinase/serine/threonine-protein kinase
VSSVNDWQRLREIFHGALDREDAERRAFVEEATAGEPALRQQVEALLAAHARSGSFMQEPAVIAASAVFAPAPAEFPPQTIGPYRIVRLLGEGGMGRVYLAQRADETFRKQAAVKVIKRGMDTDAIVRRFRQERQAMASLDHPNVAKLLDGGTTDEGLPYFVMDYVEGLPVDEYCDRHRLTIAERLQLFRTVCSAVHHAHRNLIVHRDLKPDNIQVTADGVPKLLDFGIAKVLNPGALLQTLDLADGAARCMTLDYASPEQVRGEPITTASDVYSLGVLLYELVTGHRPYRLDGRPPQEVEQTICERDPEKPSTIVTRTEELAAPEGGEAIAITPESVSRTREGQPEKLRRRLAGDLDNIILMAMRKEPQRRYASAEQLSEDINRHLTGLPVIAHKQTTGYRTRKFVRRHRMGVGMAVVSVLLLVGGLVATAYQARVAEGERARAERRFDDVRRLANSQLFELHDAIEKLPGSTPVRELMVKRALEYLTSLAEEAGDSVSLQRELATAFQKIGDVQGNLYFGNLGNSGSALTSYRRAAEILERIRPAEAETRAALAASYERIGDIQVRAGDVGGAVTSQRKALEIREALVAAGAGNRDELATNYFRVGEALFSTGDFPGALQVYQKALAVREALLAEDSTNIDQQLAAAASHVAIGRLLALMGDLSRSLDHYRKALALSLAGAARNPPYPRAQRTTAFAHSYIAEGLRDTGDMRGAADHQRQALAIRQAILAGDPANAQARRDLAISHLMLAEALAPTSEKTEPRKLVSQAVEMFEAIAASDPNSAGARLDLTITYHMAAKTLLATGDSSNAIDMAQRAIKTGEAVAGGDPKDLYIRHELVDAYSRLAEAHTVRATAINARAPDRVRHWRDARNAHQRALAVLSELQTRGVLIATERKHLEELPGRIARCDAELAKLENRAKPLPH